MDILTRLILWLMSFLCMFGVGFYFGFTLALRKDSPRVRENSMQKAGKPGYAPSAPAGYKPPKPVIVPR